MTQGRGTAHGRARDEERRKLRAFAVALTGIVLITAWAFVGSGGLTTGRLIRADFRSANGLVSGDPVRVAGVDVGSVAAISRGPGDTAIISMTLSGWTASVHRDATASIQPRLLLEGSFYVDLRPGTPEAPAMRPGDVIPEAQTQIPVQVDQVLDTLTLDTRAELQRSIKGLAAGFANGQALTPGIGRRTGASGAREAARQLDDALASFALASQRAEGTSAGDVHRLISGGAAISRQLTANVPALTSIVSDYGRVVRVFSDEAAPLERSLGALDNIARLAPSSLAALDRALPQLTSFSGDLTVALRRAPGPLRSMSHVAAQLRQLTAPSELPTALRLLRPTIETLPQLEARVGRAAPLVTEAARCLSDHVVWALDQQVPDGSLSTGDPAWLDLLHSTTGITSVDGGFDGNGSAVRAGVTGGAASFAGSLPGLGRIIGLGPHYDGIRPQTLGFGVLPPFRPDVRCTTQPRPSLAASTGPAPDWARPIRGNN